MSTIEVTQLFTYFIKGLTPHGGDRVSLQAGHGIPGDRGFALMYADAAPTDSSTESSQEVPWKQKNHFAMQNDWPGLASLTCEYDPVTSQLSVKQQGMELLAEATNTPLGRDRIGAFFTGYLAALQPTATARHPKKAPLRLVGNGHSTRYPDRNPVHISLINQASLEDLGQRLGHAIDARRFRPNILLQGIPAWEELNWVGKTFQLGTAEIAIAAPINRCVNVDVNPDTGMQDCSIFASLQPTLGHRQTGVLATVLRNGTVSIGDRLIKVASS